MKTIIKTLPALLLLAALSGCGKDSFEKPDYYTLKASTEFGQGIVDASEGYITHVKTSQETEIMDGVSLLELGYLNRKSHAMQAYIYKVELGAAMVKVSVPDDDTKIEKVQKLTLQANAIENSGKYLVMGGISGGSFNAETGAPSGILYHNSKAYSSNFGKDAAFFAVMKDGAAVCLDASEFEAKKSKVTEAVSGSAMILKDGYVLTETDASTTAKAAVGVNEDGTAIYLVVVDGGDYFYSNGIANSDMATLLKGCGASDAMILSSGKNVSAFTRDENSVDLFSLISKPSNDGLEAAIGNGLVILQY